MIRVAHIGDLHLDEYNQFVETQALMSWFVDQVRHRKPHIVTVGGDSAPVSVRQMTPAERNALADWYLELSRYALVIAITGNHDAYPGDVDTFSRLKGWPHPIYVLSRPAVLLLDTPAGKCVVGALPWPNKGGLLVQAKADGLNLDNINEACRQAMNGVLMGMRYEMAQQAIPDPPLAGGYLHPRIFLSHLNVAGSDIGGFKLIGQDVEVGQTELEMTEADIVLLSHIHKRQSFGSKIHYPGSPRRVNHGEEDEEKGVIFAEVYAGDDPDIEFVTTPIRPMKTVRVSGFTTDGDGKPCWMRSILPKLDVEGADLRIIIEVDEDKRVLVDEEQILKEFHAELAHSVKIEYRVTPAERCRVPAIREATSDVDRIAVYLRSLAPQPDPETVDRVLAKYATLH